MSLDSRTQHRQDLAEAILERFRNAAQCPRGLFSYPTGREGLTALGYPPDFIDALPDRVAECYCGVGNPFAPALPAPGEQVLDVGCGAGVDALFAARCVGTSGRVEGLEYSPDMLGRARENAGLVQAVVGLTQGVAEKLPYADRSFDLLISNGVYNLVQDKARALAEAFRVLKPGGRLQVADQLLESEQGMSCPLPMPGQAPDPGLWAR